MPKLRSKMKLNEIIFVFVMRKNCISHTYIRVKHYKVFCLQIWKVLLTTVKRFFSILPRNEFKSFDLSSKFPSSFLEELKTTKFPFEIKWPLSKLIESKSTYTKGEFGKSVCIYTALCRLKMEILKAISMFTSPKHVEQCTYIIHNMYVEMMPQS